ncbi:protein phosphatase 2c containing protein [Stylonychia lemnae]|uniref:protein-serine/threonine phosphatase n=1 Tax=Stylonychia lemnae TaxID=5949 RepID=A0A078ANT2_STYLE|nr:protein phosphatase 2c containing protein [Stylonychia lemnae]|eukprot:CDW84010.1 protein phosphatase 2c containing protein [Stylonychia lemnae]
MHQRQAIRHRKIKYHPQYQTQTVQAPTKHTKSLIRLESGIEETTSPLHHSRNTSQKIANVKTYGGELGSSPDEHDNNPDNQQQSSQLYQNSQDSDVLSESNTMFHSKKNSAQQSTVANQLPQSNSATSVAHSFKKKENLDKKYSIVKRGKVNLSQHEKMNSSGTNENLSNSLCKDLHNNSTSYDKIQSSLNNTLTLNKQFSGKKYNSKTSSAINGIGNLTNNNTAAINVTNASLNNSLSNVINPTLTQQNVIKFEQHKSQSAYQSPNSNALNKTARPNIFAKQKSLQESTPTGNNTEAQQPPSTRHMKKVSNQTPMITSYLSQQNSTKVQKSSIFNFNSNNNNNNNNNNNSHNLSLNTMAQHIKSSHQSPKGKTQTISAMTKYQQNMQLQSSHNKQHRSHIIKKQIPSSSTQVMNNPVQRQPPKQSESSSKIQSQNASLNFTINNNTSTQNILASGMSKNNQEYNSNPIQNNQSANNSLVQQQQQQQNQLSNSNSKKNSMMLKGIKSLQIEIPEEVLNQHRQSQNDTQNSNRSDKKPALRNNISLNLQSKQNQSQQVSQLTTPKAGDFKDRQNFSMASSEKAKQKSSPKSIQQQFQMMAEMPLQPAHKIIIPNHEPTKCSVKRNGVVVAYAANTNQGIIRTYNEDRVSIILNILKPPNRANEEWPKCSFFGIYDGHGGSGCADFLRDNLHQFVIKEPSFPWNPKEAIRNGFAKAEKKFMEINYNPENDEVIDKSGSCAITVLIIGDVCFAANVGDSRALLSGTGGQKIYPLSRDHKPSDENERKRIIEAGGQIYQLSVCRTFGDIDAKIEKRGGNPNVVVAIPEIKSFRITDEHDFIVIASDGIFDKLSNQESIECVWNSVRDVKSQNVHQQAGLGVEYIIKNALLRRTLDNVTVVVVAFENFQRIAFGSTFTDEKDIQSAGNITDYNIGSKKRNPQMNNTHTTGLIKDSRKVLGQQTFRSGLQTPTGNILERSLRSQNVSLEESKLSDPNFSYLNNTHLSFKTHANNNSIHNAKMTDTSNIQININQPTNLNGTNNFLQTKQLISPHAIASKYQSISTKNDEIKSKVKTFDFNQ